MLAGSPDRVLGSMPRLKAGLVGSSVSRVLNREGKRALA
jgi:hypothetical protein